MQEMAAQRPGSSSSPSGTDTSLTKIFVGGLAWETQCESMRRYFEQFGEIVEAVVIVDKHTGRSKGYGFVTFREPDAARLACVNPAPFIDGRRTNCNLAVLGAHRPRPSSPLFHQGTARFMPLINDYGGQAFQFGQPLPFAYQQQQGLPYPSPLGYPGYPPEYYAPTSMYNPYAMGPPPPPPPQQITAALYQSHVPPPSVPTFQHVHVHNVQAAGQQDQQQVQGGGPFVIPPLHLPSYFLPPPFIHSPGRVSPSAASQGPPSTPRFALQAPPFTPGAGQDKQSTS